VARPDFALLLAEVLEPMDGNDPRIPLLFQTSQFILWSWRTGEKGVSNAIALQNALMKVHVEAEKKGGQMVSKGWDATKEGAGKVLDATKDGVGKLGEELDDILMDGGKYLQDVERQLEEMSRQPQF
jgi:hypothetical protein